MKWLSKLFRAASRDTNAPPTTRDRQLLPAILSGQYDQVMKLMEGAEYDLPALMDMRELWFYLGVAINSDEVKIAEGINEHLARALRHEAHIRKLTFRRLNEQDAAAVYAIEQAVIRHDPQTAAAGHVHSKTEEQYEKLLSEKSGTVFIGIFDQDRLLGYSAYFIPKNPLELHGYDEQVLREDGSRRISIPVSADGKTGIYYLLRVDPSYQLKGIGTEINKVCIRETLGLGENAVGRKKLADFMISDITLTNLASLRAQFNAGKMAGATCIIYAAGFDESAGLFPCVTTVQMTGITYDQMEVICSANSDVVFKTRFKEFAEILDAGYVAWFDPASFTSRNPKNWRVNIAKRPDIMHEIRAEGELPAPEIGIYEVARKLGAKDIDSLTKPPDTIKRVVPEILASRAGKENPTLADHIAATKILDASRQGGGISIPYDGGDPIEAIHAAVEFQGGAAPPASGLSIIVRAVWAKLGLSGAKY